MRTLFTVTVAALLLTACSGQAAPAVTVTEQRTVTEAAPEPETPAGSDDDRYMMMLAKSGVYSDRATAIEVGQTVCNALDEGYEATVLMQLAMDAGFTTEQAAGIIAAAILAYCPWNESSV